MVRRAISAAGWTAAATGALALCLWGIPALRNHAAAAELRAVDGAALPTVTVRFDRLPAWLSGSEIERLELLVAEAVSPSTLDRSGLLAAQDALIRSGWFVSVHQVRRRSMEVVEIEATFAEPFALVRDSSDDHLVDPDGRLLPASWPHGTGPALPLILRPAADRPRHFREAWSGADVAAALQVLKLIDNRAWSRQVVAVDVGGRGRTDGLRLLTCRNTSIRWGRAPGDEGSVEPTSTAKIAFLDLHHARYGHIDGGVDGELDVSSDVAVVR